jgi:phosphatidylinositol glycan class V
MIVLPSVLFQFYGYYRYCSVAGITTGDYCNYTGLWPNMYGYVQWRYWGVGLFQYYQVSQLPNFILAAPVLIITLMGRYSNYFYQHPYI